MLKSKPELINNLTELELLALISSASVKRDDKTFKTLVTCYTKNKMNTLLLYEAVLQTYLFAGYPSALVSLKNLTEIFQPLKFPKPDKRSKLKITRDGKKSCKMIYGDSYDKLVSNIKSFSPELSQWFIEEGYGKVLSRNLLSLKKRELLICSVLASLKYADQLFSHLRGAVRLGNNITGIKKILSNLKIINQKRSAEFGIILLNKYLVSKSRE